MSSPAPRVLEQFVNRARGLYSLPAVAVRVLELTSHPKVDVRALKECLENDPALTTKILRVVNSALFGLSREVTDLNQALALLGTKPLKMLVLGFSLPRNLFAALEADVLSRYWRHTLTKAVIARELAQRYWQASGDEAFIAGLLQEIGQLVLVQDLGEPYVKFAHRVHQDGGDLLDLELTTLGFDHAVLSARLLNHWGLPESIVQAVGLPHHAATILALPLAQQPLPQILHVAELLARLVTSQQTPSLDALLDACGQYRRLSLEDLPELLAKLDDKVEQLAAVLQLQLAEHADYSTVLSAAHQQLSVVAHDAALELLQPQSDWQEAADLSQALAEFAGDIQASTRDNHRDVAPPAHQARVRGLDSESTSTSHRRECQPTAVTTTLMDAGLQTRAAVAVANCRQRRFALSLMLVQLDRFDSWVMIQSAEGAQSLVKGLGSVFASVLDGAGSCEHLGDGLFAIVLENHDRPAAVGLAREFQREVSAWSGPLSAATGEPLTLSQGLASLSLVPKNFPAAELIEAARRCLAGAQLSGGDSVKSIDLV